MIGKNKLMDIEREKYGKWASRHVGKPINPQIYQTIETQDDINHLRNTMATGNYPLTMSDCFVVGINGDCGEKCPVFLAGKCDAELDAPQ